MVQQICVCSLRLRLHLSAFRLIGCRHDGCTAIYGVSFVTAAGQTWDLLSKQGIMALINDDLSGMGLFFGNLIALIVAALSSYGIAFAFYGDDEDEEIASDLVLGLAIYGAIAGFILCALVLGAVRSAIITLFVCWAEEPAVLYSHHQSDYNELADVREEFRGNDSILADV